MKWVQRTRACIATVGQPGRGLKENERAAEKAQAVLDSRLCALTAARMQSSGVQCRHEAFPVKRERSFQTKASNLYDGHKKVCLQGPVMNVCIGI